MKTRILGMALIVVLAISTTAMAQEQGPRNKRNPGQREMMVEHKADMRNRVENFFTEEQLEKVKELRLETAKQIKPLRNELNELEAKQQTLTTAEKADMKAINNNIDQMWKVKSEIQKIRAKQHQEIRAMLSEEQLLKFDAMKGRKGQRPGRFEGQRPERGERPDFRAGA